MTKTLVERFECDNPKCDDVAEVPAQPMAAVAPPMGVPGPDVHLPDGWIEFQVIGTASDRQPQMVHASKPGCAAALAEAQVAEATEAAAAREASEEERRKATEEIVEKGPSEEN